MATVAVFLALGGGAAYAANTIFSSDIVNGEVKTPDLAAGAVKAGKLAGDSVNSAKVRNNSLRGADVDESTLQGVNASTLDGADSSDFVRGPGETFFVRRVVPMSGALYFPGGISDFFAVGTACHGAQYQRPVGITFDNQTNAPMDVVVDDGGANGSYHQLSPSGSQGTGWRLERGAQQPTDVTVFHLSTSAGHSATVWVSTVLRSSSSDCLVQVHAVARQP